MRIIFSAKISRSTVTAVYVPDMVYYHHGGQQQSYYHYHGQLHCFSAIPKACRQFVIIEAIRSPVWLPSNGTA